VNSRSDHHGPKDNERKVSSHVTVGGRSNLTFPEISASGVALRLDFRRALQALRQMFPRIKLCDGLSCIRSASRAL
jgi:hypothetical protein